MLKLTTDEHEASRGLSATAELVHTPLCLAFIAIMYNIVNYL